MVSIGPRGLPADWWMWGCARQPLDCPSNPQGLARKSLRTGNTCGERLQHGLAMPHLALAFFLPEGHQSQDLIHHLVRICLSCVDREGRLLVIRQTLFIELPKAGFIPE